MARTLMFAPIMGVLLLAACGEAETPPPVSPPAPPPAQAGWSLVSSDEGVTLRLEQDGGLTASLACLRAPARLQAATDRFTPVMSEDRFTIGAGGEAYALAADLEAGREEGVEAFGDIPADLLDRLQTGGEIAFNYGAQNLGPFPAVTEADITAFVAECRAIAG